MLYISGPAATDAVTGINKYTFRAGRQSYQDVLAASSYLGGGAGTIDNAARGKALDRRHPLQVVSLRLREQLDEPGAGEPLKGNGAK